MDISLFRKWIVEFIGTFFLVYVIGCVSLQDHVLLGPLAIGASLMVMIFAGGHISGGHYNPAVTLGVWIRGKCDTKEVLPYMAFQSVGALFAAVTVKYLTAKAAVTAIHPPTGPALLAEFLFTFALVFVVLNVATS